MKHTKICAVSVKGQYKSSVIEAFPVIKQRIISKQRSLGAIASFVLPPIDWGQEMQEIMHDVPARLNLREYLMHMRIKGKSEITRDISDRQNNTGLCSITCFVPFIHFDIHLPSLKTQ